jgi:hypothetical protein
MLDANSRAGSPAETDSVEIDVASEHSVREFANNTADPSDVAGFTNDTVAVSTIAEGAMLGGELRKADELLHGIAEYENTTNVNSNGDK